MNEQEQCDIAEALHSISHQVKYLGTGGASTNMGAIEAHAVMVKDGMMAIAGAIEELAEAIRDSGS